MSVCRLASTRFIIQVSIAVLQELVQAPPFSEAWQTRRNMPKHRWPSNLDFAAASMIIRDSLGPPSSKFGGQQYVGEREIDPRKIGVLGFSAGGHMVAAMSVHFAQRLYPAVDAADKESCRPDFAVAIYPGHLAVDENSFALNPDVRTHITLQTPPTFLLQNEDDDVDGVEQSLAYYAALKKAGVPVEMHLYAQGGHAFGLRRTKLPVTEWPQLVEKWLRFDHPFQYLASISSMAFMKTVFAQQEIQNNQRQERKVRRQARKHGFQTR
jgi:dienelactone hydrolase